MPSPPYGLHLAAMDTLAIRSATSALPRSDPGIGPKPVVTDATRSLASVRHDDSSSPCPSTTLSSILDYRAGGSFLMSTGGSLFPSAEDSDIIGLWKSCRRSAHNSAVTSANAVSGPSANFLRGRACRINTIAIRVANIGRKRIDRSLHLGGNCWIAFLTNCVAFCACRMRGVRQVEAVLARSTRLRR